jgi:hypothetical protein
MMNEYVRKQDAIDDLHTQLMYRMGSDDMKRRLDDWVKTLPSADVVQVVRCKNCKHHAYDEIFSCYWCEYPGRVRDTTPDGFCEKGEE